MLQGDVVADYLLLGQVVQKLDKNCVGALITLDAVWNVIRVLADSAQVPG
jgi:hypothetical protein